MGFFWTKYIIFDLKKYRGVMFGSTEYWCNIWKKTDLCFQNDVRNLANFHQSMFGSLKIGTLMGSFSKCMSLQLTGEFCVMTMKNHTKFEQELTCQFKIDMGNLTNFDPRSWKSLKNLHFSRLLLTKVYNVWAKKKYRGVMFDGTEDWCKIRRKTDLCFLKIFVYRLKNSNLILK